VTDATPRAFPLPLARQPLTELEVMRLSVWSSRSSMPAWRSFDPTMPATPPETIARLIEEWRAMRQVLDLVGELGGDLGALLKRMEAGQ
jgi:hypothetical protein